MILSKAMKNKNVFPMKNSVLQPISITFDWLLYSNARILFQIPDPVDFCNNHNLPNACNVTRTNVVYQEPAPEPQLLIKTCNKLLIT